LFQKSIYPNSYFHLDTKWKQFGITVAGGNGEGDKLNQLNLPEGIFIDDNETIYIADLGNHRIIKWKSNAINGQIVAGGNGEGNQMNQLLYPTDVVVDKEYSSLIIADWGNRRVMEWSLQDNTNGQIFIPFINCYGLAMDKNGYVYVSDYANYEVRRWKRGDQYGTLVAGGKEYSDQLNQFNSPRYVFIDEDDSLYVSDEGNDCVIKWEKDAKEGIVVAGKNDHGNSSAQLSNPQGVIVDQFGQIYVADYHNDRVVRWRTGASEGTIVVGGNEKGQQSNQLDCPSGL